MSQTIPYTEFGPDLLMAAVVTWMCCSIIASRTMPWTLSFCIATVRVLIPLVYFSAFYDGGWNILDDISYNYHALELTRSGYTPLSVLISQEGVTRLMALSDGYHILYSWWNLLAHSIFGPHYYSAVFLNIILVFISNYLLIRVADHGQFSKRYLIGLQIVFLFHWELTFWSSFLNIKDTLVMTLTMALLYCYSRLAKKIEISSLLYILAISFIVLWIRSYLILFVFMAAVLWIARSAKGYRKWILMGIAPFAGLAVITAYGVNIFMHYIEYLDPMAIAYGFPRMILTPQPWSIDREYSFLLVPSVLNWCFAIGLVPGAYWLCKRSSNAALLWIYAILCLTLYAAYPDLQGPRHRIQLTPMFTWATFHFFWVVASAVKVTKATQPQVAVAS